MRGGLAPRHLVGARRATGPGPLIKAVTVIVPHGMGAGGGSKVPDREVLQCFFPASAAFAAMPSRTAFGSPPGSTARPMPRLMVSLTVTHVGSLTG
ncbi:hypothetical protein SLAVM298S_08097 [Streptomyces lavendulae subsp. lavendulae]